MQKITREKGLTFDIGNHMLNFIRFYVFTIPTPLNWVVLASVIALSLKIIWLNKVPEIFAGAYEVGLISEAVIASIIASYIFYFFVVHIKEIKQKRSLYPFLEYWSRIAVKSNTRTLLSIAKDSGVESESCSYQEGIDEAFSKVNPEERGAPMFIGTRRANWREFICHNADFIRDNLEKMAREPLLLDADMYQLMIKIQDGNYLSFAEMYRNSPLSQLEGFSKSFGETKRDLEKLYSLTEVAALRFGCLENRLSY